MNRICKIKKYFNYILTLEMLRTFPNLKKNEKLYTKETMSKAPNTDFLSKILNRKKISNEEFKLCEEEIKHFR